MSNLLLLTVDCLRADRLGCLGGSRPISPNIDRLAAASAVFTQAYATGPRTAESFPGILASTYPASINGAWRLPDDVMPLAQAMRQAGYATAAFHSNPFLSSSFGYDRGFDFFWDSSEKTPVSSKVGARVMPRLAPESRLYRFLRRLVRHFEAEAGISHYVRAQEVNARAIGWMNRQPGPFFLWLHYMDMHTPFAPPVSYLRQIRSKDIGGHQRARLMIRTLEHPRSVNEEEAQMYEDLYDACLLYVDENIGHLLGALEQQAVLKDTIVIATSDHGEEFLEHGDFGHGPLIHFAEEGQARIKLYDELLHVPLIVQMPGQLSSMRTIPALVSLVDLPPTVFELLGLHPVAQWQGKSLAPLLREQTTSGRDGVLSSYAVRDEHLRRFIVSYRTQNWKYIHDGAFGRHELYDLEVDPAEQQNLYRPGNPALTELEQRVQEHLALAQSGSDPPTEVEIDPEVAERLRGLGYLG